MAQVEIQAGPFRVVSLMSREALDDLGLEIGSVAVAVVKSTTVIVETPAHDPLAIGVSYVEIPYRRRGRDRGTRSRWPAVAAARRRPSHQRSDHRRHRSRSPCWPPRR